MSRKAFSAALIRWQQKCGRHDLPWQQTQDAYRIWLSEIMLQQTQVSTVIPYYVRFLERFPSLDALAEAPVEAVLELWAGLGYYARARNLHRCAQTLMSDFGGGFPASAEAIAALPGIGRSTAAAIAVFAFGKREAILDGNVKRVLARCFGVEGFPGETAVERELWALAESLLPDEASGIYTQGLMDLGATVCSRSKPDCAACPMRPLCVAFREGRQDELPRKRPAKAIPERETTMLLIVEGTDNARILLERRPPAGIWGGLLVPPEAVGDPATQAERLGCMPQSVQVLKPVRHSFTHFHLTIRPLLCRVKAAGKTGSAVSAVNEPGLEWLALAAADSAALPAPVARLLNSLVTEGWVSPALTGSPPAQSSRRRAAPPRSRTSAPRPDKARVQK